MWRYSSGGCSQYINFKKRISGRTCINGDKWGGRRGCSLLWHQSGDKWRGRRAAPSSGIKMETNRERGGAAPPLASKQEQMEREEGCLLIWH